MIDNKLPDLLLDATSELPPSKAIDLSRAKADGARTIVRRRTGRSLVAGLAAAVAIVVVFLAVPSNADKRGPVVGAPPVVTTGPTTTTVPTAPTRFDPLKVRVAAGWLPSGGSDHMVETSVQKQMLSYADDVVITIYAADVEPPRSGTVGQPAPATAVPGPMIGGSPSIWEASSATLTWRWATNAWGTVATPGSPNPDLAAHIASTVRTDVDEAVRLPFVAPAPPAPLRLVGTLVAWHGGRFDAQLIFSDRDDRLDPVTGIPRMLLISVSANTQLTGDGKVGQPNTNLDGHPAIVDFDSNGGRVLIMGVNGTWVDVYAYDPATVKYVRLDAATALALGITVVPTPNDPTTWTDAPIR